MANKKFTVEEIVDFLRKEEENETIEGQLIKRKLIRELYKHNSLPSFSSLPSSFTFSSGIPSSGKSSRFPGLSESPLI